MVKVGGLRDVAGSLPSALRMLPGHLLEGRSLDVRLVIPYHGEIARKLLDPEPVASFLVNHLSGPIPTRAFVTYVDGLPVYMIEGAPIGTEAPVYTGDNYLDGLKYVFFSLAAVELSCETFTASVLLTPAATLVIRRSLPVDPTETTLLSPPSVEFAPRETELLPVEVAP